MIARRGVLVFPEVIKAGIGIGGEYGEGALLLDGKTVDYYSTAVSVHWLAIRSPKENTAGFIYEQSRLGEIQK